MANQETKQVDAILASRRAMLLGGSALAALAFVPSQANAAATVTSYTDTDILNFALNLEYLEANFYYMAAFGTTIDVANSASTAAGAPVLGIGAGTSSTGITATTTGATRVPFTTVQTASYAVETALEEGRHVNLLRTALGSSAVAQPAINLSVAAFTAAANAAGINGIFNPYLADVYFLVGAYIFEDVGVTAYHGAAPLLTSSSNLATAVAIHAVEAYHAGLIRSAINAADPANTLGYITLTNQISNLRSTLSLAANGGKNANGTTTPDDFGLANQSVLLDVGATVNATQIVDAGPNVIGFARNTTQVLNIVTGGGATTTGTPATGLFYPSGLNGTFK